MSNAYIIDQTGKTPFVKFDQNQGVLEITGYSLPGNAQDFYAELFKLVDEYLKKPQPKTEIKIHVEYFNTSSSKILLQLFIKFEILSSVGKEVLFTWFYDEDDIDMHDAGLTYQNSVNIPTLVLPIKS